jgi:hypothetical protein
MSGSISVQTSNLFPFNQGDLVQIIPGNNIRCLYHVANQPGAIHVVMVSDHGGRSIVLLDFSFSNSLIIVVLLPRRTRKETTKL